MHRHVRKSRQRAQESGHCPKCGRRLVVSKFHCPCCGWRWRIPTAVQIAILTLAAIASIATMLYYNAAR